MSVPVGEREEGKFSLAVKAEYLARYTIEITANENVFLPEYRRQVTDDIISTAKNIYLGIREANDVTVRVGTQFQMKDYRDRNNLQREALRNCKRLLYLIDLAHRIFHLSSKRVKYWSQIVKNVKDRIHGWIDDDTNRFMPTE
jgi:hypothetical protein